MIRADVKKRIFGVYRMSETAVAPTPETECAVLDLAAYDKNLRTIEALANSGLITDEQRTPLQMLRRLTQALHENPENLHEGVRDELQQIRRQYAEARAKASSYQEFVAQGHVNTLIREYTWLLAKSNAHKLDQLDGATPLTGLDEAAFNQARAAALAGKNKYQSEAQQAYNPNTNAFMDALIKETALKHENIVTAGRYLPMADLAVESGYVHADKAVARDLVDDVMSVQAALAIKSIGNSMVDAATMRVYENNPRLNEVRIQALAKRVAEVTHALADLKLPESTSPVLPLLELVSAQMHEAMSQHRDPAQAIKVEEKALTIIESYRQVAYSLAIAFLQDGPSKDDARTQKLLANLQKDMAAQKVQPLSLEEAKKTAVQLARDSAEDLLRATHGNQALAAKISALAKAAGVDVDAQPLQAKEQLIGEELLDVIRDKLKQGAIAPADRSWEAFVQTVLQPKNRGVGLS